MPQRGQILAMCSKVLQQIYMVVLLKDKKVAAITDALQNFMDKCGCKPNKIRIDRSSDFYNRSLKS